MSTCVHIYIYIHIHMYIYVHVHMYIYTYIHICIHVCIRRNVGRISANTKSKLANLSSPHPFIKCAWFSGKVHPAAVAMLREETNEMPAPIRLLSNGGISVIFDFFKLTQGPMQSHFELLNFRDDLWLQQIAVHCSVNRQ